jgi:hypothetical protein
MDSRDAQLSARLHPSDDEVRFLELDLREVNGSPQLGARGQLRFTTKLVFKAEDAYREQRSVFMLWADIEVAASEVTGRANLGRALMLDPVIFDGRQQMTTRGDPWTRAFDTLTLDLDHRQIDEIERIRDGGRLVFMLRPGGLIHHAGQIATLHPSNHTLTYEINTSAWIQILVQLCYETSYLTIQIPIVSSSDSIGELGEPATALQAAIEAFRRGDYSDAIADCRPALDAFRDADQGQFNLKPWDTSAARDERFYWVQQALRHLTHLAHHPTAAAAGGVNGQSIRWRRAEAEAVIALLAALIRWRAERS